MTMAILLIFGGGASSLFYASVSSYLEGALLPKAQLTRLLGLVTVMRRILTVKG